jgi:hypothetical protein
VPAPSLAISRSTYVAMPLPGTTSPCTAKASTCGGSIGGPGAGRRLLGQDRRDDFTIGSLAGRPIGPHLKHLEAVFGGAA